MLMWLPVLPTPTWLTQGTTCALRQRGHPDLGHAFRMTLDGSLATDAREGVQEVRFPSVSCRRMRDRSGGEVRDRWVRA